MNAFKALSMAMVKGFVRDRLSLFFSVLFPLFFIIIFGTVFASDEVARAKVIEVGEVQFVDQLPPDARAALDQAIELVPGTTLDAALDEVRRATSAARSSSRATRWSCTSPSADQVSAATVQGVFRGFVDSANIARHRVAADVHAAVRAGGRRVAAADPVHRAGDDRLRHRGRRGVRRGADVDHLAGEEAAAPAPARAGRDLDAWSGPGSPCRSGVALVQLVLFVGGLACCRSSGCS